jgi:Flp pilus assembly protein TadG
VKVVARRGDNALHARGARSRRSARRCRRGATAVEFALVGALFFITMLAAIEVGRFFMTLQSMRNLAADAGRYGMVNMTSAGPICGTALLTAMNRAGFLGTNPPICVTRSVTGTGLGARVVVQVTVTNAPYRVLVNVFGVTSGSLADIASVSYER